MRLIYVFFFQCRLRLNRRNVAEVFSLHRGSSERELVTDRPCVLPGHQPPRLQSCATDVRGSWEPTAPVRLRQLKPTDTRVGGGLSVKTQQGQERTRLTGGVKPAAEPRFHGLHEKKCSILYLCRGYGGDLARQTPDVLKSKQEISTLISVFRLLGFHHTPFILRSAADIQHITNFFLRTRQTNQTAASRHFSDILVDNLWNFCKNKRVVLRHLWGSNKDKTKGFVLKRDKREIKKKPSVTEGKNKHSPGSNYTWWENIRLNHLQKKTTTKQSQCIFGCLVN